MIKTIKQKIRADSSGRVLNFYQAREKLLNVVSHQEIQINLNAAPSPPARLTGETKCWQTRGAAGTVTHC